MARVDVYETEADFIEFRFFDEAAASHAERHFPTDFVRSGEGVIEYRANPAAIEGIRQKLDAAGARWEEAESSLAEDDMWPEWPGDASNGM